ncbi:MAG: oligosaccharide flippase family protein [Flavobacteriia bacterium]|nr:oligosaccharide flippase family protein [Flavobacteriia bacterium]OJX36771.1 MAG: hypothetical protein BGO87_13355 [Flavobacteriia bacterium 40-80]
MNPIRKLFGQTAAYGLPSILGRLLNYLLVPLHTYFMKPEIYGVVSELYSWVAFLIVFLTFGQETAFFRFSNLKETAKENVFKSSFATVIGINLFFLMIVLLALKPISAAMLYQDHPEYILLVAFIIAIDATSALPLAKLRSEEKTKKFVTIQMVSILINIVMNVILLTFFFDDEHPEVGVLYILLANLFASLTKPLMMLNDFIKIDLNLDFSLIREMLKYSFPLVIAGFAGIVNETMDRILLKFVSINAGMTTEAALFQVGVYSACYKLAMLISIFLQAYRYASEPFFFKLKQSTDEKKVYGKVMNYFVAIVILFFLLVSLNLPVLKYFISNHTYWEGLKVVPILLIANIFLGIYYNQSIWYKLSGQTKFGAMIAIIGAVATIVLNIVFIPKYGYIACAWTTMVVYLVQMIISYFLGQKYYPIKYNLTKFFTYLALGVLLFFAAGIWEGKMSVWAELILNNLLIAAFVGFILRVEKPLKNLKKAI